MKTLIYVVWAQHKRGCDSWFLKAFADEPLAMFTNQTIGTFSNCTLASRIRSGCIKCSLELEKDANHIYVVMCMTLGEENAIRAFAQEQTAFDCVKKLDSNEKWIKFRIVHVEINKSKLI
jgi:hypothetical protein